MIQVLCSPMSTMLHTKLGHYTIHMKWCGWGGVASLMKWCGWGGVASLNRCNKWYAQTDLQCLPSTHHSPQDSSIP